jgi:hypothetical protein
MEWASTKFRYRDPVRKVKGYKFDGSVVAAFKTLAGHVRIVVDNGDGLLHIFNEDQMERRPLE